MSGQVWSGQVRIGVVGKTFLENGINILTYVDHVHTRQGLAATLPPRTNSPSFFFSFFKGRLG
jgi:hypothetical protein